MRAPAGARGGWMSAFRRSQKRVAGSSMDASLIAKRLWIGSVPPFDRDLPTFDVLTLCALEHQPPVTAFHGSLIRCPITDGPLSPRELEYTDAAATFVARALVSGKTVLVTCHAGRNRSALVTGLALGRVTRMKGKTIVDLIRARRPNALSNQHFARILEQIRR